MQVPPTLVAWVDGEEWTRVSRPLLGARAWALGVVALQITVEDSQVRAQLRAHSTSSPEPELLPLPCPSLIQVQLVPAGETPLAPPTLPPLELAGAAARLELYLDEEALGSASLPPASPERTRAFAHVFCRWLRSGEAEPGFDLTDFVLLPPGKMYQRKVNRVLEPGQTVSYLFACS